MKRYTGLETGSGLGVRLHVSWQRRQAPGLPAATGPHGPGPTGCLRSGVTRVLPCTWLSETLPARSRGSGPHPRSTAQAGALWIQAAAEVRIPWLCRLQKKNVTHPACPQRKEKYVWHPSFLKSSASAWQSYVAGHPRGPWRERPLLATTQRNAAQPAWVRLRGTAINAVIWEKLRGKTSFPSANCRALWVSQRCSGDGSTPCDTIKGDAIKPWIFFF